MSQLDLPLLGRLDGASTVPHQIVAEASTYRQAVRLAWQLRRVKGMTQQGLAAEAGLYASHVSDYLNRDDKATRRADAWYARQFGNGTQARAWVGV